MSKHASERCPVCGETHTMEDAHGRLIFHCGRSVDQSWRDSRFCNRAECLLAELKAHQAKQDAEVARLKEQLDGVLAAVDSAERHGVVSEMYSSAHMEPDDFGDWVNIDDIKARILAAKESGDA